MGADLGRWISASRATQWLCAALTPRSSARAQGGLRRHPARILASMTTTSANPRPCHPSSPFRPEPEPVIEQYVVDDRVSHDSYGLGRVVGRRRWGRTVDFGSRTVRIPTTLPQDDQALARAACGRHPLVGVVMARPRRGPTPRAGPDPCSSRAAASTTSGDSPQQGHAGRRMKPGRWPSRAALFMPNRPEETGFGWKGWLEHSNDPARDLASAPVRGAGCQPGGPMPSHSTRSSAQRIRPRIRLSRGLNQAECSDRERECQQGGGPEHRPLGPRLDLRVAAGAGEAEVRP